MLSGSSAEMEARQEKGMLQGRTGAGRDQESRGSSRGAKHQGSGGKGDRAFQIQALPKLQNETQSSSAKRQATLWIGAGQRGGSGGEIALNWLARVGAGCLSDRALETLSECVIKVGLREGPLGRPVAWELQREQHMHTGAGQA